MALPSFFRREPASTQTSSGDGEAVEQVRRSARRRLIGAVVLLGLGVIAFPLLFETAPRPIPVDLPIEIPRKDGAPPLTMPGAPQPAASGMLTESAEAAGGPAAAAKAEPVETLPAQAAPAAEAPVKTRVATPPAKPDKVTPPVKVEQPGKTDKAAAETPAKADSAPAKERWVVQVGAFAEARAVVEVRAKVEKLGLSTYTQVVTVDSARRTRVRVGPFDGREGADAAAAKIKKAGLPVSVLRL